MTVKCDDKKCIYSENGMCTNEDVIHKVTEDPIPCITFMKNTPFTFTWCLMKKERECEYCDNNKQLIAKEFPQTETTVDVIDAVSVVRCKDCKHYNTIGCSKGFGWCENIDRGTSDNFYCANGKQLNKESEVK